MSDRRSLASRYRRAASTLGSSRTWRQWLAVANFVGYDARDRWAAHIGPGARISPTASFRNGTRIAIGEGAHVGQGCCLWAGESAGTITIGPYALLAPRVFVTSSNYDFDQTDGPIMQAPKREQDVRVGANTWLGANVVVVAGVTIGDGTVVAAGSVVTRDLPAGVVAAGVPARVVRPRGDARTSSDKSV